MVISIFAAHKTPPFASCNSKTFVLRVQSEVDPTHMAVQDAGSSPCCTWGSLRVFMAALSTETEKCSGTTEGGTSLRGQEENSKFQVSLQRSFWKAPKYNAERTKQPPRLVKTLAKIISQGVYRSFVEFLQTDLKKQTTCPSFCIITSYSLS